MGSANEIQVMPSQELSDDIFPEGERYPAVIFSPPNDVFVWVGPQEVAEKAGVGDVGGSHDAFHLLHVLQLGTQPAMHAKDLLVHNGSDWQAVKGVGEGLPELDVVTSLA